MKTAALTAAAISAFSLQPSGFCSDAPSARPNTRPPNILFCIADDASYAHFGANGCTWVHTSAFDRIAREGLLFTHAYTPNSKCSPSRACALTGRYSWQLESAADHFGFYPPGYRTFMEALALHGYVTGYTAKGWGPGDPGKINGKPRPLTGPAFSSIKDKPPTKDISSIDYAANFEAFLKQRANGPDKDKPFCFWYGSHEPHRPYTYGSGISVAHKKLSDIPAADIPAYWPDNEQVRNDLLDYSVEVEYYDTHLARMIAALEKTGELDNTIIVVTSDNGMPFPRYKGTTYEFSLHEPLAIRWPAGIKNPGRTVNDYVNFVDFAPTFLELAGLTDKQAGMEPIAGRSLVPILRDDYPNQPVPGRDTLITGQERHDLGRPDDVGYPVRGYFENNSEGNFIYLHNFEPTRWPMCDPVTGYMNTDDGPTKTAIIDNNRRGINHWQWVLNFGRRPQEELYNLATDPDCMQNLAGNPAYDARKTAMREKLFAILRSQNDPRMSGHGDIFDKYPHAGGRNNIYNRFMKGQPVIKGETLLDCEPPGFDPDSPLDPKSIAALSAAATTATTTGTTSQTPQAPQSPKKPRHPKSKQ